jgi:hypothetical protein
VSVGRSSSANCRAGRDDRASQANHVDGTGRRFACAVTLGCRVTSSVSVGRGKAGGLTLTGSCARGISGGKPRGQSGRCPDLPQASRPTDAHWRSERLHEQPDQHGVRAVV